MDSVGFRGGCLVETGGGALLVPDLGFTFAEWCVMLSESGGDGGGKLGLRLGFLVERGNGSVYNTGDSRIRYR